MTKKEKNEFIKLFKRSSKCIVAIGDETRQAIIMTLIDAGCSGMRVGDIAKGTHLSQPAVSHHLKILCDADILTMRKVGTMNFYQINPSQETVASLHQLCGKILETIEKYKEEK